MTQRITQVASLADGEGTPNVRISQAIGLADAKGSPVAHVSQIALLVLSVPPVPPVPITSTIRTSWLSPFDLTTRKLLNELQVMTGDPTMTVTIEGANLDADFTSPAALRSNVALTANVFGDYIVPLLSAPGKYRWYRLTFTSTSITPDILTAFNLEVIPFNRL